MSKAEAKNKNNTEAKQNTEGEPTTETQNQTNSISFSYVINLSNNQTEAKNRKNKIK